MPRHEKPATSHKVTGPDQRPGADVSLPPWPPCGCHIVAACVHRDHDAPRLTEPADLAPIRCEASGLYCGAMGIAERVTAGRARRCCRHYWQPAVAEVDAK